MHGFVVEVGGDGGVDGAGCTQTGWVTVGLLLVGDEVLDSGDDGFLQADDGIVCKRAAQVGVVAEAFPIPAALGDTAKRADDGPERNVDCARLGLDTPKKKWRH